LGDFCGFPLGGQKISAFCIQLQNIGKVRTLTYCVDGFSEALEETVALLARNDGNSRTIKFMRKETILEKGQFPRIMAKLPIRITPEFLGEAVDLSETGLRLILDTPLFLSKSQGRMDILAKESVETEFKVIWNRQLVQENKFVYSVCFIRFKEKDSDVSRLRKK